MYDLGVIGLRISGWGGRLGFRVYDLGVIGLRISGWGGEVRVQGVRFRGYRA